MNIITTFSKNFTLFNALVWFNLAVPVAVHADYATDFDSTSGYALGGLGGQNGWVDTSSGSAAPLGVVENNGSTISENPNGGDQVVYSAATSGVSRAIRPISVVGNILNISFDVNQGFTDVGRNDRIMRMFTLLDAGGSELFSLFGVVKQGGWWLGLGPVSNPNGPVNLAFQALFSSNVWYSVDFQIDFSSGILQSLQARCIPGQGDKCNSWFGGNTDFVIFSEDPLPLVVAGTPTLVFLNQNSLVFNSVAYDNINIVAVPEPGTYLSMAGFTALILAMAKRRNVRALSVNNVK